MNKQAIIVGNGGSLGQWQRPLQPPTDTDIIATGATWAWMQPDWICTRYSEIYSIIPEELKDRTRVDLTQESSGAWATLWALDQGYQQIWLLGFDSVSNAESNTSRWQTHPWMPLNSQPKRWQRDFQRVWYYKDAVLRLRPLLTRDQRQRFQDRTGFVWQDREIRGKGRMSVWELWQRDKVEDHGLEP